MRAMVTGATGFVGAAVARSLLQRGWQVRALVRQGSDRRQLRQLAVEIATGDLVQPATLGPANVEGTRNILDAARHAGTARIVYTSSVATIGLPADGSPGQEDTPVTLGDMVGHYKRSKFLAEQVAREAARAGAPVVIVNPSTPIGPGDVKPTPTGQVVLDAAAGRTPAFIDTGLNIVHVDDVAAGHLLALERGRIGERYILGGQDMTLREILGEIARLVGRSPPRVRLPRALVLPIAYAAEAVARITGRPGRITVEAVRMAKKRMYFSSAKAARELGYHWRAPALAFADAVRWFQEQGYLR
jgi:dihydroflavonol-4-reductase